MKNKTLSNQHLFKEDFMNKDSSLKLREMPVGKLIFKMSMPAIFSMFVLALYNVIDTIYISNYDTSSNAVVALGYAFVIQMIVMAFALGIGIGGNILISDRAGLRKGRSQADASPPQQRKGVGAASGRF